MQPRSELSPSVSRFLLETVGRRIELQTEALVHRFYTRWGWDIFDDAMPAAPGRPLALVVDWNVGPLDLAAHLLRRSGLPATTAHTAPVMLAKIAKYKPELIVTGLNILRSCPTAYEWMLFNLARPDGIPTVFWTAASEERRDREIPRSPRCRVVAKSVKPAVLLEAVQEMLRAGKPA
jgi:CheY-like chemotaxis protein